MQKKILIYYYTAYAHREIVLLNAETIEATWSYHYSNFDCNSRRSIASSRNRVSCYWSIPNEWSLDDKQ
jgi:hypothetical protein